MLQRLKQKIWLQIFIIYTRYIIGSAFVFASIVKIRGGRFTAESGASNPIDSSWHLFETLYQSGLYWKFLGIAQLISGVLLMTQRYAKLGAIVNLPIIANVFAITISYYFAFTPVITGLMLLANIMLIAWDWNTLKVLINQKPISDLKPRLENDVVWQILGLLLFTIIVISNFFANTKSILVIFLTVLVTGLTGLIIGFRKRKPYK
ncbi:hypothetical protein DIS18_13355 [Algibacter marinivivus]|uniref:DoxX protein n=1 Tax=Algibacter marinivivus TaxID=2100723 RepID=A0A2U2X1K1_9FLAO|nr:hypothetical protein [Algibacter marinivivus]PWH81663.1 hypothetical protein DIS18_13355 [Algibacter marinivivus]